MDKSFKLQVVPNAYVWYLSELGLNGLLFREPDYGDNREQYIAGSSSGFWRASTSIGSSDDFLGIEVRFCSWLAVSALVGHVTVRV